MIFNLSLLLPVLVVIHILGTFAADVGVTRWYSDNVGLAVCELLQEEPGLAEPLCGRYYTFTQQ